MCTTLNLHNIILHTRALGPGVRAAIWFQGCERRCKGCMSPSSKSSDGGRRVSLSQICETVLALTDIEGVTISGGEPFLQPEALHRLLSELRKRSSLGVIIYTGYRIEELSAMKNALIDEIITSLADLIIDGEYMDELNDGKSLKGSSNQRPIYVTERYLPFHALYEDSERNVEVRISGKDALMIGVPDRQTLTSWIDTAKKL